MVVNRWKLGDFPGGKSHPERASRRMKS